MIFKHITPTDTLDVHWTDIPMVILDLYPTEVVQAYCEHSGHADVAVFVGPEEGSRLTGRLTTVSGWRANHWRSQNIDFVEPRTVARDDQTFVIDKAFTVTVCSDMKDLVGMNLVGVFVGDQFVLRDEDVESIRARMESRV